MADVRCPMCGKPNPPERDTCRFCQARLKPLIIQQQGSEAGEKPDWLNDLRPLGDEASEAADQETPSQAASELDDWLSRIGQASETTRAQVTPAPQGSSGDQQEPPSIESTENLPGGAQSAGEPEWLRRIHARQQTEQEQTPPADADGGTLGSTEWLSGLAASTPAAEEQGSGLPDWLTQPGPQASAELPAEKGGMPDWLKQIGEASFPAEESPAEEIPAAEPGVIPDWLTAAVSTGEETAPQPTTPDWQAEPSAPAFKEPAPEEAAPAESTRKKPGWFSRLSGEAEQETPASVPAFVMEGEGLESLTTADESAPTEAAPELEPLPDWVSKVTAEAPAAPSAPSPETTATHPPDLTPSQLPTWLEAMRPVEAAAPTTTFADESDTHVENAGPLAGLRGVLPAEVEIARIRKPPVYTVKLQVNETQQARIALLENMLASESRPKAVIPHVTISSQYLLRIGIAIALILAVFGAIWMGEQMTILPDPADIPAEVEDVEKMIVALPSDPHVLVAFDYEPGLTGEMESAAAPVITHLLEKRIPLTLVSTSPTGPLLAMRLLEERIQAMNDELQSGEMPYSTTTVTNLGYIPGSIAGLRGFADAPAKVLPYTLSGEEAWLTEPLTQEATLDSFNLVLVIADTPDIARAWIEQVEPKLKLASFMMIISAQAAPMIRPYYEAGQVDGLIAGLAEGEAYENLTLNVRWHPSNAASTYWDSFSASLLVSSIIILVGGLFSAMVFLIRASRRGES
jgi:hypothetical protein